MTCIQRAFPFVFAAVAGTAPQVASADCNDVTLCIKWTADFNDLKAGDFATEGVIPARGAKFALIRPQPEQPITGILDQNGCTSFNTGFSNGHKLVVSTEAVIGDPPTIPHVRIRVVRQVTKDVKISPKAFYVVNLNSLMPGDVVNHTIPREELDPMMTMMAGATEVMWRLGQLGAIPTDLTKGLTLYFQDWTGGASTDPADGTPIALGPDSFKEKYVIGHEMGHWLQIIWSETLPLDYGYAEEGTLANEPCQFGVVPPKDLTMKNVLETNSNSHGIRSAEWSTSAMTEGFGHFIASAVFNDFFDPNDNVDDDGVFRYYKDIDPKFIDYAAFVAHGSLVSLVGGTDPETLGGGTLGGENRWTETRCSDDWGMDEVSSEIDWLRFFWRFLTKSGDAPTLPQILAFFREVSEEPGDFPIDEVNVFPMFRDAMEQSNEMSPFVDRFVEANEIMGVFNDDSGP